MEPEPLKNKSIGINEEGYSIYHQIDVRSAVEWLKEDLVDCSDKGNIDLPLSEILCRINEAFEDVMEKECERE